MIKNNIFCKSSSVPFLRILHILIVFAALLGTQYSFPVNLLGRIIYLYLVEVVLIALFISTAIYLLVKRQKPLLKPMEWLFCSIFIVWFAVLTAYRWFSSGDITGGFIVFRVLVFPILFVLMLRQLKVSKKDLMFGAVLFATYMNVYHIYGVISSGSFRTFSALKNINVYLCFMLALLPLLFIMLKQFVHRSRSFCAFIRILLIFNILCILVFSFFSGSRLSVAVLPVCFVPSFLLANGFSKKTFLKLGAFCATAALIVTIIMSCNIYDSRYNVSRTWTEILSSTNIEHPSGNQNPDIDINDPDSEYPNDDQTTIENNITDSNTMRDLLWEQSIAYIRENPIWGRTSIDIPIEMNFVNLDTSVRVVQSPHNFILEGWLALGLPGLLLYAAIVITTVLSILRKKISLFSKLNLFIILFAIFGFSFFQPLVTCFFAISLILWFVFYLFAENDTVTISESN